MFPKPTRVLTRDLGGTEPKHHQIWRTVGHDSIGTYLPACLHYRSHCRSLRLSLSRIEQHRCSTCTHLCTNPLERAVLLFNFVLPVSCSLSGQFLRANAKLVMTYLYNTLSHRLSHRPQARYSFCPVSIHHGNPHLQQYYRT